MWSRKSPDQVGWYWYTDIPKDWDLARPIPISFSSVYGYNTSNYYLKHCVLKKETQQSIHCNLNQYDIPVSLLKGLWYGPIDLLALKISPPKELLQD